MQIVSPTKKKLSSVSVTISNLDEEELNVLNTAQLHNLGKERNVGLLNYEISIRGKKNFKAASRKLVLNKSNDLIFNPQTNASYKTFMKIVKEIKKLKINWNLNMLELQEKGYSEKVKLNTKIESQVARPGVSKAVIKPRSFHQPRTRQNIHGTKYLSLKKKPNKCILQ